MGPSRQARRPSFVGVGRITLSTGSSVTYPVGTSWSFNLGSRPLPCACASWSSHSSDTNCAPDNQGDGKGII